jgi:undecaprenyl-diphosphatase
MPTSLQAALLGIVQGLTEFLPVSSTAHLILARAFFGLDSDRFGLAFDVACHVGTLVAVVVYFRREIAAMVSAVPRLLDVPAIRSAASPGAGARTASGSKVTAHGSPVGQPFGLSPEPLTTSNGPDRVTDTTRSVEYARLIWLLVAGTIPAVVVGLLFGDFIEDKLRTVPVVVVTLAVVAIGLFWAERAGAKRRGERSITFAEAFWIGCAQAIALVPGVSRSGATLIAALLIGLRREDAARFIFLLSIPAILGAAAKEAPKMLRAGMAGEGTLFAIGVITSAIVGFAAVKYFIRYLARHSLDAFAWYRLALAGTAVLWLALRT